MGQRLDDGWLSCLSSPSLATPLSARLLLLPFLLRSSTPDGRIPCCQADLSARQPVERRVAHDTVDAALCVRIIRGLKRIAARDHRVVDFTDTCGAKVRLVPLLQDAADNV